MDFIEIIKVIIIGIVEGITEWLPISSTGHMILVEQFLHLNMSESFIEMFRVVIQLGAIMAVVVIYWKKIFPFSFTKRKDAVNKDILLLWVKIVVACIPAGIIGVLFDDKMDELFYNHQTVAITLILYGILFIIIENRNKHRRNKINNIGDITYQTAFIIGLFQVLSLIPGTSRSGVTILGAILIGTSRTVAAEFTFFLAIPVMFGASLFKIVKFGIAFTSAELAILIIGVIVAYVVSVIAIKFLVSYIKKHDFKVFGWYRIVLGIVVILYFTLFK
ncbi:MAG: undecaprenyl-diphosphate phosphatase [Vallitalea sp.]|jgi:undecaprenyl-diphosphatase|nr:undecaprenyl-diphosphate phosphatase [Vallitalea sp.]